MSTTRTSVHGAVDTNSAFPDAARSNKSKKLRNAIAGGFAMLALVGGSAAMSSEPAAAASVSASHHHVTKSQKQAVGKAKDYLRYIHFSKKGLIEQLRYEGFSRKDATYAVNHIKVNWNKQAAGTAKDYLKYMHFSRSGLIEQLEYERFTRSQAVYGVKKVGL